MNWKSRRVVTGHDASGNSIVLSDGEPPKVIDVPQRGVTFHEMWNTDRMPALVAPTEEEPTNRPRTVPPPPNGTRFRIMQWAPGFHHVAKNIHRTETVDYCIVLEGEVTLTLDDSVLVLHEGDVVIQRGTNHAWQNLSDRNARMAFILIDGQFEESLKATLGESLKVVRDGGMAASAARENS